MAIWLVSLLHKISKGVFSEGVPGDQRWSPRQQKRKDDDDDNEINSDPSSQYNPLVLPNFSMSKSRTDSVIIKI